MLTTKKHNIMSPRGAPFFWGDEAISQVLHCVGIALRACGGSEETTSLLPTARTSEVRKASENRPRSDTRQLGTELNNVRDMWLDN